VGNDEVETIEQAWRQVARISGLVAGGSLFAGTVLFLLDALDALGSSPTPQRTDAGALQDEANFWVAEFAHQHHLLWDIICRDTLFPLAFMALIALALATRKLVATERPEAHLMATFFAVGGTISALSDLVFLAGTDFWRPTGWSAAPAERLVAVGRSTEALGALTRWPEAAGFVVLAFGLACLGRLCRLRSELPSKLALFAYGEGILLLGIAIAGTAESDTAYNIFSLLTGALFGPLVAVWLGSHLGQTAPAAETGETVPATV
jgi:hypothetical protein